ncbi:MAG: glutamate 5-kinase [Spirochaetes bacterium]|nr:MAG: glutamate 5-kinase [Spirochaetota bacterium]
MKRIVIKIGSSIIYKQHTINYSLLKKIVYQINILHTQGWKVFLVSSGAIALGMKYLKIYSRPSQMSILQSCASVGQVFLMELYNKLFKKHNRLCAQVLLTWEDFVERARYLNAQRTLLKLSEFNILPIINENDTVSVEEIKFGDNDRLSSLVACLVDAKYLIILTDVEGLFFKGKLLNVVEDISDEILKEAKDTTIHTRIGGMRSKIEAARIATTCGIKVHICSAFIKDVLLRIVVENENLGTVFLPKKVLKAKKRWIAFSAKSKGKIFVDKGAKEALIFRNCSLLSPGIIDVEGEFKKSDIVEVASSEGEVFAKGMVNFDSSFINKMKGKKIDKEIIHRDYLVLI